MIGDTYVIGNIGLLGHLHHHDFVIEHLKHRA
jgi:hypothetical protein